MTRNFTNVGYKFEQARLFVENNPASFHNHPAWRRMSWRLLYATLQAVGAVWSVEDKVWRWAQSPLPRTLPKFAIEREIPLDNGFVLISIIAHRVFIDRRCAEIVELAEALNWTLVKTSHGYRGENAKYLRRYLKFKISEDGD